MAERYTRKDAERYFAMLMRTIGGQYDANDPYASGKRGEDGVWRGVIGQYCLDYAGLYGGFCINRTVNEAGGVTRPYGNLRRNARAFCEAIRFAVDVAEEMKRGE